MGPGLLNCSPHSNQIPNLVIFLYFHPRNFTEFISAIFNSICNYFMPFICQWCNSQMKKTMHLSLITNMWTNVNICRCAHIHPHVCAHRWLEIWMGWYSGVREKFRVHNGIRRIQEGYVVAHHGNMAERVSLVNIKSLSKDVEV